MEAPHLVVEREAGGRRSLDAESVKHTPEHPVAPTSATHLRHRTAGLGACTPCNAAQGQGGAPVLPHRRAEVRARPVPPHQCGSLARATAPPR
jgi:hypothetical protein